LRAFVSLEQLSHPINVLSMPLVDVLRGGREYEWQVQRFADKELQLHITR
jgi:hypothetical protein